MWICRWVMLVAAGVFVTSSASPAAAEEASAHAELKQNRRVRETHHRLDGKNQEMVRFTHPTVLTAPAVCLANDSLSLLGALAPLREAPPARELHILGTVPLC